MSIAEIKLIFLAAVALLLVIGTAVITHKVDNSALASLKGQYEAAAADAAIKAAVDQKNYDDIGSAEASALIDQNRQIDASTQAQLKDLHAHVQKHPKGTSPAPSSMSDADIVGVLQRAAGS